MEGVAFGLRDSLDLVAESGHRPQAARVSGGGVQSDLWLEILASVLEIPIETTQLGGSAAFGAALLAAVTVGAFPDMQAAVATCVRPARTVEPSPELSHVYAGLRPRFRSLYEAHRMVWDSGEAQQP